MLYGADIARNDLDVSTKCAYNLNIAIVLTLVTSFNKPLVVISAIQ